jgi:hypothetical protein
VGCLDGGNLLLLLGKTLGDEGVVLDLLLLLGFETSALEGTEVTAALETDGSNETLDFGSLGVGLGIGLLRDDLTADNILANIVLLAQVEELADLGGTLRAQSLGEDVVGQTRDVVFALLDDNQGEDSDIGADDAATNRLALALTSAARAVARVAVGKEETDTVGEEDTLLHGETLLVVTTSNAENVALPLIANGVSRHFLAHALFVEVAVATLLVDVNQFLGASGGVSNIELHDVVLEEGAGLPLTKERKKAEG